MNKMDHKEMSCAFYSGHSRSYCLRDAVKEVATFIRGNLWLCEPHKELQEKRDDELCTAILS